MSRNYKIIIGNNKWKELFELPLINMLDIENKLTITVLWSSYATCEGTSRGVIRISSSHIQQSLKLPMCKHKNQIKVPLNKSDQFVSS